MGLAGGSCARSGPCGLPVHRSTRGRHALRDNLRRVRVHRSRSSAWSDCRALRRTSRCATSLPSWDAPRERAGRLSMTSIAAVQRDRGQRMSRALQRGRTHTSTAGIGCSRRPGRHSTTTLALAHPPRARRDGPVLCGVRLAHRAAPMFTVDDRPVVFDAESPGDRPEGCRRHPGHVRLRSADPVAMSRTVGGARFDESTHQSAHAVILELRRGPRLVGGDPRARVRAHASQIAGGIDLSLATRLRAPCSWFLVSEVPIRTTASSARVHA